MSNLIQNSGFEIPGAGLQTFQDWNQLGNVIDNTTDPHSGEHAAQLGPILGIIGIGSINQEFTGMTVGHIYNLSFYAASYGAISALAVTITNILNPLDPMLNLNIDIDVLGDNSEYTFYSFDFTATNETALLSFIGVELGGSGILIDDVSITSSAICFSGNSLVHARNTETGVIGDIKANQIVSGVHEVYSVNGKKFVPVKLNIVNGPVEKFIKIKKNLLGKNQPNEDFYVTSGHKIVYKGKEIKAKNIPGSKRHKLKKPEMVYSICVDEHEPILVNNLPVIAWGYEEWLKRLERKKITWKNNSV